MAPLTWRGELRYSSLRAPAVRRVFMGRRVYFDILLCTFLLASFVFVAAAHAADATDEWKKIVEAAKKEGKIVAGGPPNDVLRKQFKKTLEPLKNENMLAPFMDYVVLPEVKDPKQWWGGHMWEDNLKTNRFIYSFSADFSVPPFYNA